MVEVQMQSPGSSQGVISPQSGQSIQSNAIEIVGLYQEDEQKIGLPPAPKYIEKVTSGILEGEDNGIDIDDIDNIIEGVGNDEKMLALGLALEGNNTNPQQNPDPQYVK